jgi:adenosylcobyric acid synthase
MNRGYSEKIDVEVICTPGMSGTQDFAPLHREEGINLRYVKKGERIGEPHLLIIPGTRNTIRDLVYLKRNGYADKIRRLSKDNTVILGISGGFQMLGTKIIDIKGSESYFSKCDGLSFFNIVTRIMPNKQDFKVKFVTINGRAFGIEDETGVPFSGYETHAGRTKYLKGSSPLFNIIKRGRTAVEIPDGAVNQECNIFGTYIHGVFRNENFRERFLKMVQRRKAKRR